MVNICKMTEHRFAAPGDAVFNELRRFAQGERVASDGVGCAGQVDVVELPQGEKGIGRSGAKRIEAPFFWGD
jgi:predicted DNA-binding protein with PD1-like motif